MKRCLTASGNKVQSGGMMWHGNKMYFISLSVRPEARSTKVREHKWQRLAQ